MPQGHVIDLVDDDDEEEQYDSIPLPEDIEDIENTAGPSRRQISNTSRNGSGDAIGSGELLHRQSLKERLAKLDGEVGAASCPPSSAESEQLRGARNDISVLQKLERDLLAERSEVSKELETLVAQSRKGIAPSRPSGSERSGVARSSQSIDYQSSDFDWSSSIRTTLKNVFGLSSFRLCQEGVINAAIEDRDIVCVMPTGGGKSLTYQLPAVLPGKGLTVVISPLLALIWDQVRALKELQVECVVSRHDISCADSQMLTGNTSKEEQNAAYRQMEQGAQGGSKEMRVRPRPIREIHTDQPQLCYVTVSDAESA